MYEDRYSSADFPDVYQCEGGWSLRKRWKAPGLCEEYALVAPGGNWVGAIVYKPAEVAKAMGWKP